ncbi:PPAN, partial [Symbiodinium microadriaticum]
LFHYIKENSTVEMRHYAIRASPVGISRNIKKIIQAKIPKLGNLQDISEFLEGGATGGLSDSEAEDDPAARVELPERYVGAGNAQSQQSAMRLMELGPRMTLELFK